MRAKLIPLIAVTLAAPAGSFLASSGAQAADMFLGPLRGTQYVESGRPTQVWQGVYFGGFGGMGGSNFGFKDSLQSMIAHAYRNEIVENTFQFSRWLSLPRDRDRAPVYGGFAGYNFQYDEIVLGFEADYTRTNMRGNTQDQISRGGLVAGGNTNEVHIRGDAQAVVKDIATVRARAGYTMGRFLPFATAGFAVARMDVTKSVNVNLAGYSETSRQASLANFRDNGFFLPVDNYGYENFNLVTAQGTLDPNMRFSATKTSRKTVLGMALGAGVEMAVTDNIFLRGEWQTLRFLDIDGMQFNMHSVRAGAGVKF